MYILRKLYNILGGIFGWYFGEIFSLKYFRSGKARDVILSWIVRFIISLWTFVQFLLIYFLHCKSRIEY